MKTILINRAGVCMADDVDDHHFQLKVSDKCSYSEMIKTVSEIGYLPIYDTMWLVLSKRKGLVAAYYNSSYSNKQFHIIWQQEFNENDEIDSGDTFFFDCHMFKREMYKYARDYDSTVEFIKGKYNISNEFFNQIDMFLCRIRKK